jgi:peptidoglycan/LPS O-acetylase OafA/YrhL
VGQRAALYCRVSTADQACDRQERDLCAFAKRGGFDIVGVHKDKPWINGVAWTLAIEFQYYILMLIIGPLLLSNSKISIVLLFALVVASSLIIRDGRAVCLYLPCFGLGFASFLY